MPASPAAEMSALATTLDELTARVTALAQRLERGPTEGVAIDLFEVERSLRTAGGGSSEPVETCRQPDGRTGAQRKTGNGAPEGAPLRATPGGGSCVARNQVAGTWLQTTLTTCHQGFPRA